MSDNTISLQPVQTWSLGASAAHCRAVPLRLGSGAIDAIAVAHTANIGSNPWGEMFSFPTDTQKLSVLRLEGRSATDVGASPLWQRDLGEGVIPDQNFCPIMSFDLDGDGIDELYFINNVDPEHPLAVSKYRLERVEAATGRTTGQWPWPRHNAEGPLANAYRNFIFGGYVHGQPVLVTAQGTYLDMYLQGWNPDMTLRWQVAIAADSPGARGSHMHPVLDLNGDGVDELMWGERCLELDKGTELFCADRETYSGHSDIIQPFIDPASGRWLIFTAREKQSRVFPRVAVYDSRGQRLWGAIDQGHMHIGWVARFQPDRRTALAVRIGGQVQTRQGRQISGREIFAFDASSGRRVDLPFDPHQTIPIDLNGDGLHELVRGTAHDGGGTGDVLDGLGHLLGNVGGPVAMASRLLDLPGEQVLTYGKEGTLRLWADANARQSDLAQRRYAHPFYALSQRMSGCGNHLHLLGGI